MVTSPLMADWTTTPAPPWSRSDIGIPLLVLTLLLLAGAAAWTYLRLRSAAPARRGVVLGLRLLAFVLLFFALSGSSCESNDDIKPPSVVFIGLDASLSMEVVKDEVDGKSRWQYMIENLRDLQPLLEELDKKHKIKVVFRTFGDKVEAFDLDSPGTPTGKHTDTAQLLRALQDKVPEELDKARIRRALFILSDGANNVESIPTARDLAVQWKLQPCPIHVIPYGSSKTTDKQNDIAITGLTAEPPIVAAKGRFKIRATVDALGFVNAAVNIRIFINGVEGKPKLETLKFKKDNVVLLDCDAPNDPGDVEVVVKVHRPDGEGPLPGETDGENNEDETYVTVAREGLSVLLIERQDRYPEPQMLLSALAADRRIRVDRAWIRGRDLVVEGARGFVQFDQQPYDVIILGDVSKQRLLDIDGSILTQINDRVFNKKTGFMMMGGRYAFAKEEWKGTPIEDMLPVLLDAEGQADRGKLVPTDDGLAYLLRLGDSIEASKERWNLIPQLNGYTRLGTPKGDARVMARTPVGEALMVTRTHGKGRVMAFAGDTTHHWVRPLKELGGKTFDGGEVHARFWKQVVLWLAQQENVEDNLRLKLDTRTLFVKDKLGVGVELRGKQGEKLTNATYEVHARHESAKPEEKGDRIDVLPGQRGAVDNEQRGIYEPPARGKYIVTATGSGTDAEGKTITGRAEVKFKAKGRYDSETSNRAANPDFLRDLARDGGGTELKPSNLRKFLLNLPKKELPRAKPEAKKTPDWRTDKESGFLLAFLLLFVQVLALEWFLRRRWGMV